MFSQLEASSGLFVLIHILGVLPLSTWDSVRVITKPSATPSTTVRELERGEMRNIITTAERHPICEALPVPVPARPVVLISPTPALSPNKLLFNVLELEVLKQHNSFTGENRPSDHLLWKSASWIIVWCLFPRGDVTIPSSGESWYFDPLGYNSNQVCINQLVLMSLLLIVTSMVGYPRSL